MLLSPAAFEPKGATSEIVVDVDKRLKEFATLTEETRAALTEVMPALLAQNAPVPPS